MSSIAFLSKNLKDKITQFVVNARRRLVRDVSAELIERTDSMLRLVEQQFVRDLAALRNRVERLERLERGTDKSPWSAAALLTNQEYLEFASHNGGGGSRRDQLVAGQAGKNPVMVLGCADLEVLRALRENGAQLLPVEPRTHLLEVAQAAGYQVDARPYRDALDALPADSVQVIVAPRLEEELPPQELRHLLDAASRVLPHGGQLWLDLSAAAVPGTDFLLRRLGFPEVNAGAGQFMAGRYSQAAGIVLLLLGLCGLILLPRGHLDKPNLILISVDGCRADHMSCYGYGRSTTPNLDRLSRQGATFEHSYSQSNESLYSHASLFSSLYASEIGPLSYSQYFMPPDLRTLPKVLHSYGYQTAAFCGGGHLSHEYGFDDGFDTYYDEVHFGNFFHTLPPAMRWLEQKRDPRRPVFMFLHGYDCHRPYHKPRAFGHLYDPGYQGVADQYLSNAETLDRIWDGYFYPEFSLGFRWTRSGDRPIDPNSYLNLRQYADATSGHALSAQTKNHILAHYDASITYADTWLGMFFACMEEHGMNASNTVIAIMADHGEDLMEHGTYNHRVGLQLSNIHVPLIFWGRGVRPSRSQEVTQNVDIFPTLLHLAGISPLPGLRGTTLLNGSPGPQKAYSEGVLYMASVVTPDHELIAHGAPAGSDAMLSTLQKKEHLQYYDLAKDPSQQHPTAVPPNATLLNDLLAQQRSIVESHPAAWRGHARAPQRKPLSPQLRKTLQEHGYFP